MTPHRPRPNPRVNMTTPPKQQRGGSKQRWSVSVCVKHGDKDCLSCLSADPWTFVEVVPASDYDDLKADRDNWKYVAIRVEKAEAKLDRLEAAARALMEAAQMSPVHEGFIDYIRKERLVDEAAAALKALLPNERGEDE